MKIKLPAEICLQVSNKCKTYYQKYIPSDIIIADTEMSDLVTVDKAKLPGHDAMNTYFLDLAAVITTKLKTCFTIRQLTWQVFHAVPDQFSGIYFVCVHINRKVLKMF